MRLEINFDIVEDYNRSQRNSSWNPSAKETTWCRCENDIKVKLIYTYNNGEREMKSSCTGHGQITQSSKGAN